MKIFQLLSEMRFAGDLRTEDSPDFAIWAGWRSNNQQDKFLLTDLSFRPNGNGTDKPLDSIGMKYIPIDNRILVFGSRGEISFNTRDSHSFPRRAPNVSNPKSSYTIPRAERSFYEEPLLLRKILRELMHMFPETASYTVADLDPYVGMSVDELAHTPTATDLALALQKVELWHGTSTKRWKEIKRTGLEPGNAATTYVDQLANWSEHNVYLAMSPHIARNYATRAAVDDRSNAAVLAVTVTNPCALVVDEDTFWWLHSSVDCQLIQAAGIENNIHKSHLSWMQKQDEVQRELANTAFKLFQTGVYSGANSHGTFGYRGRILPKYIRLAETYKPAKMPLHPDEDEYQRGQEETEDSRKDDF